MREDPDENRGAPYPVLIVDISGHFSHFSGIINMYIMMGCAYYTMAKINIDYVRRSYQCLKDDKQRVALEQLLTQLKEVNLNDVKVRKKVVRRLQGISRTIILEKFSGGDFPLLLYLFWLKYHGDVKLICEKDRLKMTADGVLVADKIYHAVYLHFMELAGGNLQLEGNVLWPVAFSEVFSLRFRCNGKAYECTMQERMLDCKIGQNIYEKRTAFTVSIPLTEEENEIQCCYVVDGHEYICENMYSMRFMPVCEDIKGQYCVRDGWIIHLEKGMLHCRPATDELKDAYENAYREELKRRFPDKAQWAIALRENSINGLRRKKKPIWLFMDRRNRADDNAEALFRYVRKSDEIDSYFILEQDSEDYRRLYPLGNVIPFYSSRHLELVMQADYVISSQANGEVENPFWENAELFRDLYHRPRIVFLQHGVIKDDMSVVFNRYHTNFTGFVTSTKREWQSILDYPYQYTEKEVWLTGLPRFDYLYNDPQKYILIMPTWRKGLMSQVWHEDKKCMVWEVGEGFLESEYVKAYQSLLANEKLAKLCKEFGYHVAFMPHALMEPYIEHFIKNENCVYWDAAKSYREAFAQGNILITDYSSVAFDFAYLKKPIIYYQFDKKKFFQEHTYSQGYFDYESDGLGQVVNTQNELLAALQTCLEKECRVEERYMDRINHTFAYMDRNNCERVYEHLKK